MAGGETYDRDAMFDYTRPTFQTDLSPEKVKREVNRRLSIMEAMDAKITGYDVPIPDDPPIPAIDEEDAIRPKDLADARDMWRKAGESLKRAEQEFQTFVDQTDSISPTTEESAKAIKERAAVIARARRDLARQKQALADSDIQLTQAEFVASTNPPAMPELLNQIGKKLGFLMPLIHTLEGPGEMLRGLLGTAYDVAESVGALPNYAGTDVEMTLGDWVTSPFAIIDKDHALRKRGRDLSGKVSRSFEVLGEIAAETPLLKAFESASGYDIEKKLGKLTGFAGATTFDLALDPLNFLEFGPVTKVGKARQLARVNAGALETIAIYKAMQDVPEIGKLFITSAKAADATLTDSAAFAKAWESVQSGEIATRLVDAGADADKAAELAKAFDSRLRERLANYRSIASVDKKSFADQAHFELSKLPETEAIKKQKEAVLKWRDFGDDVDMISGRSVREQISLGQRGRVLRAIQQKFGDMPWYKKLGDPWAFITGMSLKHDSADVPEIFAAYTGHRLMRGQIGAEFLRFQQDAVEGAAKILAQFDEAEQAAMAERLPSVVEKLKGEKRTEMRKLLAETDSKAASARVRETGKRYKMAREEYQNAVANGDFIGEQQWKMEQAHAAREWEEALAAERAAKQAYIPERARLIEESLLDLADLYDHNAVTFRAIQNRFNLKVMDLAGEFGYMKRGFNPELQQFVAQMPEARAWFFNESTKQSRKNLTALLDGERGRALRAFDFHESEQIVLEKMRSLGYTGKTVWSRDAFGDLARAAQDAQRKAEVRTLYDIFVEAVGKAYPKATAALRAALEAEDAENAMMNAARVAEAQRKLDEAKAIQERFRKGHDALRKAEGRAETLESRLGAAEGRAQEVRIVSKESGVESPAAYEAGREAQNRAVIAAEALKSEATDLVSKTPGAAEARKALAQARKILTSANATEAMQLAAKELALVTGGAGTDLVAEAKRLVKLAEDHIAANPKIAEADKVLRTANAILAEARDVAARVEVGQLVTHLDDLLKSAKASQQGSAQGGAFLTNAMRHELEKAHQIARDVREYYRLRDAQKEALASGDKQLAAHFGSKAKALPHKSIREVRSALSTMRAELRKDAPKALVDLLESAHDRASSIAMLLDDAQQAVAKPVALSVNQRVRDAEKYLEWATELQAKGDTATWTNEQHVNRLMARHKVTPGNLSGLQLLKEANVPLPHDLDSLVRLATTEFTPAQGKQFKKIADGTIWDHINTPHKILQVMDIIKGIMQKSALSWFPSVAKDNKGSVVNLAMSGAHTHLKKSLKHLNGFDNWRKGKVSPLLNRLRGEGVMRTTVSDTVRLEPRARQLALEADSKAAKVALNVLARVEERGVLGAAIPGSFGEKVAAKMDALLDWRVYVEESGRLATYLKAIDDGFSHAEAVEEVFKYWGKFDELHKLERDVFNRVLFFWAWQARSIPVAVAHILNHPVRSRLVLTATAGDATEDETMPPWLKRMGAWIIGRNDNGTVSAINTGGSYFDPMISMLQSNFANEIMAGKPIDAVGALGLDVMRSLPPHLQALPELFMSKDLFTTHDWWRNRNAETDSNAKAPTVFWYLHGDNMVSKALGLQPVSTRGGEGQYLTMDPRWAWFFGALPGVETRLNDVSAFFSAPELSEGEAPAPDVTPVRGIARHLGFPMYEVPLENGKRMVYDLRTALIKDADELTGGSLVEFNGNLSPSKTPRGVALRNDRDRWRTYAKEYLGMTPVQVDKYVSERTLRDYPQEGRVLMLQDRIQAWERYLVNLESGSDFNEKDEVGQPLMLAIRRAATSRISEFEKKKEKKRLDSIMPKVR